MTTNANTGRTLQTRRLISSLWLVLRKNFILILVLSVALKFGTQNLASFLEGKWLMAVIGLISANGEVEDIAKYVIGFLQWMLYWMLLTILVTRTSFDALNNPQRRMGLLGLFDHAVKQTKGLCTADGIRVLLRCVGVMVVTYAGLLAIPIVSFLLLWLVELSIGPLGVMGAILWVLSILTLVFLTTRWSMAMPEVIVRKAGVVESLANSWRLTRSIWIKMLVMSFLLSVVIALMHFIVLVALFAVTYLQSPDVHSFLESSGTYFMEATPIIRPIFEVMLVSMFAIWITVQYYLITSRS